MDETANRFSENLLDWYDHHGRKSLPWQQTRDPYAIWVSEIMLQQTQVSTVIPYYQKFMARFPDVRKLAHSDEDEVLHHWSGLGYYARARNLHSAARQVTDQYDGRFPDEFDQVLALPGIGRSTAGSILAFAHGQRHPILDGNVKRVLTRYFAIAGFPGTRSVENELWQKADLLTPKRQVGNYNQAIMDLGATVCRRRGPSCVQCPLGGDCTARREGNAEAYPTPKPKKTRPRRVVTMLLIGNECEELLLVKRPPQGVWGGLWSLPEADFGSKKGTDNCHDFAGLQIRTTGTLPGYRHAFTHFDLDITPVTASVVGATDSVMDSDDYLWYNRSRPARVGLPGAVSRIMDSFYNSIPQVEQ